VFFDAWRCSCNNPNMLVLASASPRRRELLTQAGFTFQVHPAHIPEDPRPNEDPIAYVVRLAREKAEAVFAEIAKTPASLPRASAPPQVVLGADTTVVLDGLSLANPAEDVCASIPRASAPPQVVLGKPENAADAARMLRLLSGRTHRVITGVAVVTATRTEVAAEVTGVTFLTLSDKEIEAYIATGEPMDKAGAYAIQGRAARWIPRITGDYSNVVGLPIALVTTLLEGL